MTCTVIPCEQRSPAWYQARAGLLCASDAAAMLAKPKRNGEETVGKAELRLRLALEALRGEPLEDDPYDNEWMRRGRLLEADAVGAYEARTGELVTRVGFLRHDILPIGCSPDGLIGDGDIWDGGVEVKVPKFTTHYEYVRKRVLPSEYAPQIMHSLYVTGLPWWDFVSYGPEFDGAARLFLVRVWRDAIDLDAYALALQLFLGEVETVKTHLRDLTVAPELIHAETE